MGIMNPLSSDHLLRLISSAFPGLLTYVDTEYRYVFANGKYLEWFKLKPENIIGLHTREVIGEENFQARKPYMDRALKGERVTFSATVKVGPDKELRELEQIYDPDYDENGNVRGLIAMAYDVTNQRTAEKAARESEARFRSLTEVMPQLVWVADDAGKTIYINENWPRVTGTTLEENLGNGWLNVLHPEDRINTVLNWDETLQLKNNQAAEYRIRMADGSYRWHVSRAIAIKDDAGKIVRWVGTTTDIEEQKNARDMALYEKRKMYSLFEQAPVAIVVLLGPEHHLELVNLPARKYFPNRKLVGLTLNEAIPELEGQGIITLLDEIYNSGKGVFIPAKFLSLVNEDGSIFEMYADLFYEPIKDDNGLTTGILNMCVDVTEQVKALKFAEEKEHKLEEALIARDQFLSIASHELKTPLTSLKLQAQLTLRSLSMKKELPLDRQTSMAHQTNELVGRLTRLIDDMLDVSRIKTGKLKLDKSHHELGDIVREVVFRMGVLFEEAGLPLPSIKTSENLMGEWDRFRLEQVIGNLLTNAIRYGKLSTIEINLIKKDARALLSVTDKGYGIAEADLTRIFGRFERAINSSEVSGLGLGLFISKEIVDSHGGKIWVESTVDEGSTFFVELPIK